MTSPTPQTTDFTRDVLGRYICNGLDEAIASANQTEHSQPLRVTVALAVVLQTPDPRRVRLANRAGAGR